MIKAYNTERFGVSWSGGAWGNGFKSGTVKPPLVPLWSQKVPQRVVSAGWTKGYFFMAFSGTGAAVLSDKDGSLLWHQPELGKWHPDPGTSGWLFDGFVSLRMDYQKFQLIVDLKTGKKTRDPNYLNPQFLGTEPLVYDRTANAWRRWENGKPCGPPIKLPRLWPHTAGDPYWLCASYPTPSEPKIVPTLSALDPNTRKFAWERKLDTSFKLMSARNWLALNWNNDRLKESQILEAATGKTVLTLKPPPDPWNRIYRTGLIHPDHGLALANLGEDEWHCFDIGTGRIKWKMPRAWIQYCTGDVLWTRESRKGEDITVARSIKTGKELWSRAGAMCMRPGDGCFFSWSGKTVTCWVSESDPRLKKAGKAAPAAGKKTVRRKEKAPPPPGDFREFFTCAADDSLVESFSVAQILKVLRNHFPAVTITAGNEIEIFDDHDQHLGTISFAGYLPKDVRKIVETTPVTGMHVNAATEPVDVGWILINGLKTLKNRWNCDPL